MREHGRAHARAAHLAQGDGAGALGQAALETGLARRGLALAGHQAVAKQHFGHQVGGNAGALDGSATCHYRTLPLLYARESDRAVEVLETLADDLRPVLRQWGAFKRMVIQGEGAKARTLFDRANLPRREQVIRNTLKREGLWVR